MEPKFFKLKPGDNKIRILPLLKDVDPYWFPKFLPKELAKKLSALHQQECEINCPVCNMLSRADFMLNARSGNEAYKEGSD